MFSSFKYVERINFNAGRCNARPDLAIAYMYCLCLFAGTLFRRLVVQTDRVYCLISGPEGKHYNVENKGQLIVLYHIVWRLK